MHKPPPRSSTTHVLSPVSRRCCRSDPPIEKTLGRARRTKNSKTWALDKPVSVGLRFSLELREGQLHVKIYPSLQREPAAAILMASLGLNDQLVFHWLKSPRTHALNPAGRAAGIQHANSRELTLSKAEGSCWTCPAALPGGRFFNDREGKTQLGHRLLQANENKTKGVCSQTKTGPPNISMMHTARPPLREQAPTKPSRMNVHPSPLCSHFHPGKTVEGLGGGRGFKDGKVEVPKENAKWCGGRRGDTPLAIPKVGDGAVPMTAVRSFWSSGTRNRDKPKSSSFNDHWTSFSTNSTFPGFTSCTPKQHKTTRGSNSQQDQDK
jgi:hypothetical protein